MTADYKSESCCSHTAADPATLSSQELPRRSVPAVVPSTPIVPKQSAGSW